MPKVDLRPFVAMSLVTTGMLAPALSAQAGQFVSGVSLGSTVVRPAGDVDDDGLDDYLVRLAQTWEVRSGATAAPFAFLGRSANCVSCYYAGLRGDLDADGRDDLVYVDGNGTAEFVSGATGALLFSYSAPGSFVAGSQAVDHDGDGFDDVMVGESVFSGPSAGVRHYHVLSGRNGSPIASYTLPAGATNYGYVQWCGDVDGDGHVDLQRTTVSFANPYTVVLQGPGFTWGLASFSGSPVAPAGDTNGDGRDELLVALDLVDVVTAATVWSLPPAFFQASMGFPDVDGDGAADILVQATQQVCSGRLQSAWPGSLPGPADPIGDIDGDGRDELAIAGAVHELQGVPAASYVRDRGTPGTTSSTTRPRIRHRLRPRLGDAMWVDLLGAGGPQFAFLAIGSWFDADLGPSGAPGNRAYVDPFMAPSQFADATGHARFVLAVPNAPALVGASLSLQWAVVDPAANALGVVTSNALDTVVGN